MTHKVLKPETCSWGQRRESTNLTSAADRHQTLLLLLLLLLIACLHGHQTHPQCAGMLLLR